MSSGPRFIYLHGFASGPRSRKAAEFTRVFAERGFELEVPDLNPADFRDLTVGGMLDLAGALIERSSRPVGLIGSSLGGYLAAALAGRSPQVRALVLLAPAFGLRERWEARLGADALHSWKRMGSIPVWHHGLGEEVELGWEFYAESSSYPAFPDTGGKPVLVFHGRRDEVVPLEAVERFQAGRPGVELEVLDDEHALAESIPRLTARGVAFLLDKLGACK
jgi:hypothetical protein